MNVFSPKYTKYSVVLPTYNRTIDLERALLALVRQTIPLDEVEVLVVDDGSSGNGLENQQIIKKIQEYNRKIVIKYFYKKNGGNASARNLGIRNAIGEIIFSTDDDVEVPPYWMEKILEGFRLFPAAVGVGGVYHYTAEDIQANIFARFYANFDKKYFPRTDISVVYSNYSGGYNRAGNTANMAYKKSVFKKIGLFDENISYTGQTDWEFRTRCLAYGFGLVTLPLDIVHHKKFTLKKFILKSIAQGRGQNFCDTKYPDRPEYKKTQTILGIFELYSEWIHVPPYAGSSGIFLLYLVCRLIGRYLNIFLRHYPKSVIYQQAFDRRFMCMYDSSFHLIEEVWTSPRPSKEYAPLSRSNNLIVTVIIPTYNRIGSLLETLSACVAQSISRESYEIIVVDDGSTDGTYEIVSDYFKKKNFTNASIIKLVTNSGPSHARNVGVGNAKGNIIAFTDDDCVPPKDWISKMMLIFYEHPETCIVAGWHHTPNPSDFSRIYNDNYYAVFFPHVAKHLLFTRGSFSHNGVNTANLAVRKYAFNSLGGFNESMKRFEDTDFGTRAIHKGLVVCYSGIMVLHQKNLNLAQFLSQGEEKAESMMQWLGQCEMVPLKIVRNYFNPGLAWIHFLRLFPFIFANRKKEWARFLYRVIFYRKFLEYFPDKRASFIKRLHY